MDLVDELDIKVIDCDTHVVEAYDLWTSRVSTEKYGDRVPHVVRDDAGVDLWVTDGNVLNRAAWAAAAGWKDAPPNNPERLDEVDPRVWNPADRIKLMDDYGIYAQVLYPNVSGFGAGRFADMDDPEFSYLLIKAYNDYLTDYASVAPGRYIPIAAVPFWDLDKSIEEMERCRSLGHRGIIFSQAPQSFGQPSLSDPYWDRLWAAAQDMDLVVNFHIGSGDTSGVELLHPSAGPAANYAAMPVTFFTSNCTTIAALTASGICHRFPRLNFVSVESGIGWIPFALQALDWMWAECAVRVEHPEYDLLPSEYFKRQIYGCFWFEHSTSLRASIELLGADSILYETDFPHSCSMAPGPASCAQSPRTFITEKLGELSHDVLRKLLHDNAARIYHLD
jgi:predicted TIM-barrel fold metal-dependent hydrolase